MSESVLQAIVRTARQDPDRPALSDATGIVSYRALANRIEKFAAQLSPYRQRCVVIDMDNSPDWVVADLACMQAGAIVVPLPPFFSPAQRANALSQSGAAAIIGPRMTLTTTPETYANEAAVIPEGSAKITYTSGTTAAPKGVCLNLSGMVGVARSIATLLDHRVADKTACLLPLGVLLENIAGCYASILAGGCYDVRPQAEIGLGPAAMPDFERLAHYLAESGATSCILVPELLRGLLMAIWKSGLSLPAMRFMAVGGSKVSATLLDGAAALGLPVYQGYGLSECASVVTLNIPEANEPGSVGKPLPHIRLSVATDGEILVHDPAFCGYLGAAPPEPVYRTGDLGHMDGNGFLFITGRKKNVLILSSGRNISPEWPESELLTRPEILQCLVLGDAAPQLSALIVPTSDALRDADLQGAIDAVNAGLPPYAQIAHWHRIAPFTQDAGLLTGTGRPRRDAILNTYRELISDQNTENTDAAIL